MGSNFRALRRSALFTASALPFALAFTGPALAQDAGNYMGEEIVVTSQKRAENVQDIPLSIAALTADALTNSGVSSVESLETLTAGLSIDSNANFVAPYIRGVGTQYANPGLEPSVAIYLDDLYVSRASAGYLSLADIERVEVLKGPQGTLYGMSNTGGAIRIITREPTDSLSFGGGVSAGNYGQAGGDIYVNGPITENLLGRFSVQYDHSDGYVDPISGLDGPTLEDRNSITTRGKLTWNVTENLTVRLAADYTDKNDHEGQAFLSLFPNGLPEQTGVALGGQASEGLYNYASEISDDERMRLQNGGASVRIDYDAGNFVFSSITGFRHSEFSGFADLDATTAPLLVGYTMNELTEAVSQEFQFVSTGDGPLNYTFGLHIYHEVGKDTFGFGGLAFANPLTNPAFPLDFFYGTGVVTYDSIAPYMNVGYEISPEFELVFGLRYTSLEKSLEYNNAYGAILDSSGWRPNLSTQTFLAAASTDRFTSNQLSPKLQLVWRPTDDMMFYASATRGYKAGGFNLPQPQPIAVEQVEDEQLTAYELGWKLELGNVRLNGSYFHYDAEDLQVQITSSAGITSVVNAGSSTTDGVELEATWYASQNLTISGAVAYLDAQFEDFPNGPVYVPCADFPADPGCVASGGLGLATIPGQNLAGNRLPLTPELSGNIMVNYEHALPGDLGSLNFNVGANFTSEVYFTPDNNFAQDDKTLVNAAVGWTSSEGRFGAQVYGTNLTDEEYITHVAPFAATGGWRNPGQPMMYGVRLTYDY